MRRRTPRVFVTTTFVLFAWIFARSGCAQPAQFYVALDGNDAWSGRFVTPNTAKTDGPIATLDHARDILREHRRGNRLPEGAIVVVGEGTYILEAPLELTVEDAGTEIAPVVYLAATGKQVRLLGGKVVRDWKRVEDAEVFSAA